MEHFRALWSAPAERSDDGALAATQPLTTPVKAVSRCALPPHSTRQSAAADVRRRMDQWGLWVRLLTSAATFLVHPGIPGLAWTRSNAVGVPRKSVMNHFFCRAVNFTQLLPRP